MSAKTGTSPNENRLISRVFCLLGAITGYFTPNQRGTTRSPFLFDFCHFFRKHHAGVPFPPFLQHQHTTIGDSVIGPPLQPRVPQESPPDEVVAHYQKRNSP